jgi:PEP-CTERM motif
MNTNARISGILKGCATGFTLAVALWYSPSASAAPIRFSTSGNFDLPAGTGELAGVTGAEAGDRIGIGTVAVDQIVGVLGSTTFHLQFKFNDDLPSINVSGTIPYLGYNPDVPVLNTVVSTTASSAQLGMYPELFKKLIEHPDWLHTTSFRSSLPTMEIALSVHQEDPGAMHPVPEPSSFVIVALACAGVGWRVRRTRR